MQTRYNRICLPGNQHTSRNTAIHEIVPKLADSGRDAARQQKILSVVLPPKKITPTSAPLNPLSSGLGTSPCSATRQDRRRRVARDWWIVHQKPRWYTIGSRSVVNEVQISDKRGGKHQNNYISIKKHKSERVERYRYSL